MSRGRQSPEDKRNVLSLHSFVASFLKKMSFEVRFCTFFFHDLIHVAPAQGQTDPRELNFGVKKRPYHFSICCKFQRKLFEV